jgi:hypothetical protein
MIMAVSLTVLLAIIGSSFVLMSRLDRQSVRNASVETTVDAARDAVLSLTQKQMASGLFQTDPATGVQTLKPELCDHPGATAKDDLWLADIEPVAVNSASVTNYFWPHVSDLEGTLQGTASNFQIDAPPANWADADGDGVPDSILMPLAGITVAGKNVLYAVRIIDNCGMVNENIAWKRSSGSNPSVLNYARSTDPDSYGEFLHQIDLYRLLARTGVGDPYNDALSARCTAALTPSFLDTYSNFDLASILYEDLIIRDYAWFGLVPYLDPTGKAPQIFGLADELELRNRFSINTTSQTPIETAMMGTIGAWSSDDPTGSKASPTAYRIVPYSATDSVPHWYAQVTDDRSFLKTRADKNAVPRAEQRHYLTDYSYSREMRVRDLVAAGTPGNPGDNALDGLGQSQFVVGSGTMRPGSPGKYRKVNINTVLRTMMEQNITTTTSEDPTNPLPPFAPGVMNKAILKADALRRVALAFAASGYTWDQGYQFIANLIDYIDVDNDPTVFDPADMTLFPPGTTRPTVPIYGNERQPFIVEVYNAIDGLTGESKLAGVELFNPYDTPIITSVTVNPPRPAWQLFYQGQPLISLDDTNAIPPGGSVVYVSSKSSVPVANGVTPHEDAGLLFNPPSNTGELILARPAANGQWIAVDRATGDIFGPDPSGTAGTTGYSIWRGIAYTNVLADRSNWPAIDKPVAPWGWARSTFSTLKANAQQLGSLNKIAAGDTLLDKEGISIPIGNRGAIGDPPSSPTRYFWRVNGWNDLSRVLFVGSPDVATILGSRAAPPTVFPGETYTIVSDDKIYEPDVDTFTAAQDTNGNGVYDPPPDARPVTEKCTTDATGSVATHEFDVRLDFQPADPLKRATKLMNRLSLFSRADDRMDNENTDDDNNPGTGFDSLLECRTPGRININTAPKSVLKALFPAITYDKYVKLPGAPTFLSPMQLDSLSTWFADAVVNMRQNKPFVSLADFENRLGSYKNDGTSDGAVVAGLRPDALGRSLWFGRLIDQIVVPSRSPGMTIVGDPYLYDDSEERDWIFSRIANLITVRSDTFSAYILIRLQDQANLSSYTDSRYVAILDRSNVFLPEDKGRNGGGPDVCTDVNNDGMIDPATGANEWRDTNLNGVFEPDDSGEALIFGQMPFDPDYYDRQYTTPKVVALQPVADPR